MQKLSNLIDYNKLIVADILERCYSFLKRQEEMKECISIDHKIYRSILDDTERYDRICLLNKISQILRIED